jgi:hypothetical protein
VTHNAQATEEDKVLPSHCSPDNGRQKSVQYVNIQWEGPAIVDDKVVRLIDLAVIYTQSNGIATKGAVLN